MITSIHTLIYSNDANATRAFLRDVLGWKYVAEDFDNDWLIFKSGPSELGVHPTHSEWEGKTYDYPRHHSIALMCDDIDTTVGDLRSKGAQFQLVRPRNTLWHLMNEKSARCIQFGLMPLMPVTWLVCSP